MPNDQRTLAELAQEALDVQTACNLHGVVNGWGRSIARLKRLLEDQEQYGTDLINGHPINKLWADKVASLTQRDRETLKAYDDVIKMAKG